MINWKIEFKKNESGSLRHYEGHIIDKILENGWTLYLVSKTSGDLCSIWPSEITKILMRV